MVNLQPLKAEFTELMNLEDEKPFSDAGVMQTEAGKRPRCIYLTPQGKVFNQTMAEEFALEEELIFLCGHYEGIDERVLERNCDRLCFHWGFPCLLEVRNRRICPEEELIFCVMIDAISRFVPLGMS